MNETQCRNRKPFFIMKIELKVELSLRSVATLIASVARLIIALHLAGVTLG